MSKTKSYEWNFRSDGEKERREIKLSHPTCGVGVFLRKEFAEQTNEQDEVLRIEFSERREN